MSPYLSFPIPLKPEDSELVVPLQEVFFHLSDRAQYATRIDYHQLNISCLPITFSP
ncbi:MAG: DUF4058 family protein [Cyanobacteria bacterium CRU_2_1]|nr:DUF4058 family protein [Cyanobacteria bacterium CRU_2_1]